MVPASLVSKTKRVFNFSPGPAVLPLEVLEQAREDLLSLPGVGISILEISHRSPAFDQILESTLADLRSILALNKRKTQEAVDNYIEKLRKQQTDYCG